MSSGRAFAPRIDDWQASLEYQFNSFGRRKETTFTPWWADQLKADWQAARTETCTGAVGDNCTWLLMPKVAW